MSALKETFFSTREEFEEKEIFWEIEYFPDLLQIEEEGLQKAAIVFETGTSIVLVEVQKDYWGLHNKSLKWVLPRVTVLEVGNGSCPNTNLDFLIDSKGIPATWRICFSRDVHDLGIVFQLKKVTHRPAADAVFTVWLKGDDKVIWGKKVTNRKKYNPTTMNFIPVPQLQTMTTGISVVKVCFNITTYKNTEFLPVQQKKISDFDPEIFRGKLVQDFSKILHDNSNGDVSIKVPSENGFYSLKAHKTILAARSAVFRAMFDTKTDMMEVEMGEVLIPDLSPLSLRILLEYIYTGKVSEEWEQVPGEILNAAEKYDLPELKQFCGQNVARVANKNMEELLELAQLHNISDA